MFYNMYEMYESIYVEIMIMPRVKRRPILFWKKSKEAENNFLTLWCHLANSPVVASSDCGQGVVAGLWWVCHLANKLDVVSDSGQGVVNGLWLMCHLVDSLDIASCDCGDYQMGSDWTLVNSLVAAR